MEKEIFIKGLADRRGLEDKNYSYLTVDKIIGIHKLNILVEELYEADIKINIVQSESIEFNDKNLNIITLELSINIIAMDEKAQGVFFKINKYEKVSYSSFTNISNLEVDILTASFNLENNNCIEYKIIIAVDNCNINYRSKRFMNNPFREIQKSEFSGSLIKFIDEEFL